MQIYLSNSGQEPIYAQITRQIKQQILSGALRPGDALPSIRLLAKELRISVITTKRAYEDLERDGFILTQQGRGSFVAEQNPALLREEHLKKVEDCLQGAVDAARLGGIGYDEVAETLRLLWEGGPRAASTAALRGITKQYKDFTLGPVDMTVPAGSIVGLIGENGAGKTTLLKILCGVNRADDGTVDLLGGSPADAATRAKIGVVFEDAFFYGSFTAAQVARSLAGMYGARWNADSFSAYLRRFGLDAGKKLKEYSRGMRLKLSLAAALAHAPELLVLDEATAGLDPVVRGELLDLFLEFIQDERHSIVMSSHITADLEQIADSIAYLHNGQLLFQENKDDLLQEYGVLHCGEDVLTSLPAGLVVFTRRGAYGCESLVRERRTVQELLPEAVCDAARLDDIMRFYSGRDAQ